MEFVTVTDQFVIPMFVNVVVNAGVAENPVFVEKIVQVTVTGVGKPLEMVPVMLKGTPLNSAFVVGRCNGNAVGNVIRDKCRGQQQAIGHYERKHGIIRGPVLAA